NAGMDHTIILGNSTTLNGSGGINYSWSPSSGLDCSNCPEPAANPLITTSYIVTVTDANGCQSSDTVVVIVEEKFVVYVPNIFSPNGDLLNDVLLVRGGGVGSIELRI